MPHTQVDVLNNNDRTFASPTSPLTQYNIYAPGGFKLTINAATLDTSTHLIFYRNSELYDWPEIWRGTSKAKVIGTPPPKGMGMGYLAILSIKVFQGEGYANDYCVFEWLRTHSQPMPDEVRDLGVMSNSLATDIPTSRSHSWYKIQTVVGGGLRFGTVDPKDALSCFETTVIVVATATNAFTIQYSDYVTDTPTGTPPAVGSTGYLRCLYTPHGRKCYWL